MKKKMLFAITMIVATTSFSQANKFNSISDTKDRSLFIDVHDLTPGKVSFSDVMEAHKKDLATEGKYDVSFIKFWVDEQKGKVYCLSSAKDAASITKTHAEAHGLLPSGIYKVTDGLRADEIAGGQLFIDIHELGPGKVTAAAVAEAHKKDLQAQKKYGVNFLNYWVDESAGKIYCLSQAPDSSAIIKTHKEAHGLLPAAILKVKQGE
ncbi:DUF4242 domain-containing protein [Flavihumibacter fluvii]|uniref:DUF4242 domain-containing protein n=1 Tax=Flavihumibacter fluvii TaxID=2838157 RepID=UPI001BDE02F2|nr:DUF4242 domain-containing protein [Flavihumibacter fluvii]ULQ51990.1 DUF4242 domain-containing protein [Flavihumibacter fluvii]